MEDFMNDSFSRQILETKYLGEFESPLEYYKHLSKMVALGDIDLESRFFDILWNRRFSPGGRILAFGGRPKSRMSLVNCTTHSVEGDSLEDISDSAYSIMRASSRGQGIGVDISKIRPKESPVNNAARTSTGAISFMEMFNSIGGTIGQEGRRAAMLFSIHDNHPDLYRPEDKSVVCDRCNGRGCGQCVNGYLPYDFIHVKRIPGKVENANISVKISDALMRAVESDQPWKMSFWGKTGNGNFDIEKTISARDLFGALTRSAYYSAEPGVLYWDTSKNMSNSNRFGKEWEVVGLNACTEQVLDQDGVCVLGSINLSSYVVMPFTKEAFFDFSAFVLDVVTAVEFLDNIVTLEIQNGNYISERQRRSLENLRRLGLGIMGYADMLGMLGLNYAYEQATIDYTRDIMSVMRDAAYKASIHLAIRKGPAPVWNHSQEYRESILKGGFFDTLPAYIKSDIIKYGTRNVAILSIAPTGSISNLLGVSSGIEPLFALSYTRMTRIHGFDEMIDYVQPSVKMSREKKLPDSIWQTAYQVPPIEHVRIQALFQEFVDSAISKTTNLPNTSTVMDVADIYKLGWQLGLKGMSVYVDGSRTQQVLYQKAEEEKCPVCSGEIVHKEGCTECMTCGWSKCSL